MQITKPTTMIPMMTITLPVSVNKTLLRRGEHKDILVFNTPNQGLESRF